MFIWILQKRYPYIRDLTTESDHGPFAFAAGIPSLNLRFINKDYNLSHSPTPLPDYPQSSYPGKQHMAHNSFIEC